MKTLVLVLWIVSCAALVTWFFTALHRMGDGPTVDASGIPVMLVPESQSTEVGGKVLGRLPAKAWHKHLGCWLGSGLRIDGMGLVWIDGWTGLTYIGDLMSKTEREAVAAFADKLREREEAMSARQRREDALRALE